MCVAIPMKIKELKGDEAVVELDGFEKTVNMMVVDDIKVGDYVMIHAGFAIQKVREEDARITLETLREYCEKIEEAR